MHPKTVFHTLYISYLIHYVNKKTHKFPKGFNAQCACTCICAGYWIEALNQSMDLLHPGYGYGKAVCHKSQRKRYIMYKNTFPVSRITTTCIVQREYYKLTPVL